MVEIYKDMTFENIFENFPSMIGYWDKNLRNKFGNKVYLEFFNMTREEMLNKHIKEVIGDNLFRLNQPHIEGVLAGKIQAFEREIPLRNGEIRYVQTLYVPDTRDLKVEGFYVLVTDITQIKKLELEKAEMLQKFIHSSRMVALGEMASGIAHEINNPLSIIKFNVDILSDLISSKDFNQSQLQKHLSKVITTANRIEKIVTGLLFFSQGRSDEEYIETSVLSIIEDTTSFCIEKFKSKNINFIQPKIDGSLKLLCKPTQVSQVILNLLNNAADAVEMSADKWIAIGINDKGDTVDISVTDSGPGISPEILDKVMQPFFTTKDVGKGTGLGLSVSKGIVEDHKGNLSIVSEAKNTTFLVTLPKKRI